jgi:RimJ/RimL family protein N-acetyltransferase
LSFLLETDRLFIRPFRDSDLTSFVAYRGDAEVARHQGWSTPYTLEQGQDFIDSMKNTDPKQVGEWHQAAVELKASGEMVGDVAHFIMINDPRQAYLGYTVARPYWRRGFATEATLRLLAYLFVELDLHRVVAETDVENVSSIHLLERLGFRCEAHLVENVWFKGAYASEYHYALLRREWDTR